MTTKLDKLGDIWTQWNLSKLPADQAMHQIGKLYPRATMRRWRLATADKVTAPMWYCDTHKRISQEEFWKLPLDQMGCAHNEGDPCTCECHGPKQ